jgi:aerobic C4-dicarboxylate transport protein
VKLVLICLTSKRQVTFLNPEYSGVQGPAFVALVATLKVIPTSPVAAMALIPGIDHFMSMSRALVNLICNGVATIIVARWENELDLKALQKNLS